MDIMTSFQASASASANIQANLQGSFSGSASASGSASVGGSLQARAGGGRAAVPGSPTMGNFHEMFNTSKFWVEIDGMAEACFVDCSGLTVTTETVEYKEGGVNGYSHKLPGRTTYSNVTLKLGMVHSTHSKMWEWYSGTARIDGKIKRQSVSIILYSPDHTQVRRWTLANAYPVKWTGPAFTAKGNEFAVESVEFVYDYFTVS